MAIQANQMGLTDPHGLGAQDLRQNKSGGHPPELLQLPVELLERIVEFVATGPSEAQAEPKAVEAGINAGRFGLVCALAHDVTHQETIHKVIVGTAIITKPRWVEDPNNDRKLNLVNYFTGEVMGTMERNRPHFHV
jgi:hypothetical protein